MSDTTEPAPAALPFPLADAEETMSLPRLPRQAVHDALDFLQSSFPIKRPPYATAAMLVLICELHKRGLPWPTRREAAAHCGMSVYGLDGALSVATARGLIHLSIETSEGNVARRESVVKHRYYTPSPQLRAALGY